jgi:hypothetical protein
MTMNMIRERYTGDMYIGDGACEEIITIYALYETILNVINNLILIKHDIEQHVNADTLKLAINELKQLMEEQITLKDENKMFEVRQRRGRRGPQVTINLVDYPDEDKTNTATEFFEGIIARIDNTVKVIVNRATSVDNILNEMYKQLKECIDIINQVINEKNKFFSLTYLEQYIACFKGEADQGDMSCIFYNRLRKINTTEFPLTFTEYYLRHQEVGKAEAGEEEGEIREDGGIRERDLIGFMRDLPKYLVYMHNYDFNIFFKGGDLQSFNIPHLQLSGMALKYWDAPTDKPVDINVNGQGEGKYSTGYFLCLYKKVGNGITKRRGAVADLYPPITQRMEERNDVEYQFIHQSKQSLGVCAGTGDAIIPIALEHTGYIMKIIIAKIVFVVGGEGGQEGEQEEVVQEEVQEEEVVQEEVQEEVVQEEEEGEEYGGGIMRHIGGGIIRNTGAGTWAGVMRGGADDSIIDKVLAKIREPRTQQQTELVKILGSLKENKALLKKFINKYILSLIEKNISVYIGDECGELMALQVSDLNLNYPGYAQIVRLAELTPLEFRKGVDMVSLLFKDDEGKVADEVKEIVISIYNKNAITHMPNSKKVFRNKCANVSMSNFECVKRLGIRLKDRNGNTILNRLIDQYNIPALKTLIRMDPGIKTFRNNRNQTPQEYIKSLLKIIADKYDANTFKSRIIKYGYILMSYLEPTALANVDLELYTSEEFIVTIIKYNICMFNEFLWSNILEFNNFLTVDELMAVLRSMGHVGINTRYLQNLKTLLASKIDMAVDALVMGVEKPDYKDKDEERHKQEQLRLLRKEEAGEEREERDNGDNGELLKVAKITDDKKEEIKEQIKDVRGIAQMKTMVDTEKVYEIYYDIVRLCFTRDDYSASSCPKTVPPIRTQPQTQLAIWEIASSLLKLELKDAKDVNVNNFFEHFVKKIYEDYYDLDQNEDAEYNYVQHEILSIIFLNVGSMVAFELVNRLMIYCDKHHISNAPESVVGRKEGEEVGTAIKRRTIETRDKLYAYAKDAMTDEIIEKLGVKNPDKQYATTDTHDDIIIDALKTAYSFVVGETDIRDIKQIITFYRTLAENIAKNSYDEMRMILDDLRRKSLLIEIASILQ